MNILGGLLIFSLFTEIIVGSSDPTYHLSNCNGLTGKATVFIVDETVPVGYTLYNISNISGKPFSVNSPEGYLVASETSDGKYGLLKVGKQFDYESNEVYKYSFTCEYPFNLQVKINNVVEDVPVFKKKTYNARIKEDISIETDIISLVEVNKGDAPHDDIDINTSLFRNTLLTLEDLTKKFMSYLLSLDTNDVPSVFKFNAIYEAQTDPPVKYSVVLNGNLDYNTQSVYYFDVEVYVKSDPTLHSKAHFNITVEDVDDHSPVFDSTTYHISIKEGMSAASVLKTTPPLLATDDDKGLNIEINYKLIQAFPNKDWFDIKPKNGDIIVKHSPDREECEYLTLFVKAYQIDKEDFRYSVAWVNVTISDIDDNNPVMDKTTYTVSIPENSPDGTRIIQVHATDKDKGENAKFLYYFKSPSNKNCNGMELDQSTGIISVGNSSMLDREVKPALSCQILVKGKPGKQSKVSTLTVTLIDENDNNPVFNPDIYNYTIKKNLEILDQLGQVIATDNDLSSAITYTITDKTFHTFTIGETSGKISLTTSLKEFFLKLYSFEVVASDGDKKAPRYTSVIVNIHVEDVNIHDPEFDPKHYNISVLEDVVKGTDLIQLKAKDKDPDDKLTFSIIGNSSFNIDTTSGMLSIKNGLDYEHMTSHSIPVRVSDSIHSATTTVTVSVVDINDNAPKFNKTTYRFLNIEEEKLNALIGSVHATDADSGKNKKFTYSIEKPWSSNLTINSDTGRITVNGKLDRESMEDSEIKFIVMATDQGHPSLTGTTEVIIEVTDVNDHCPYLNVQDRNFTYDFKELEKPTNFHRVQAQDMDKTSQNRIMKYDFLGSHVGFAIDQGTGYISATREFTMENSINGKITLHILVSNIPDCKEKETAKQTVVINLQDVNRYTPQFKKVSYNFTLKENYTVGNQIKGPSISATDNDVSAKYNTITYWISGGNDGHFYMDQKTADIYLIKPLDYESKTQYRLQVDATDGHVLYDGTYKNASVNVLVSVENVNDVAPQFTKDEYTCTFLENHKTSTISCKVSANDSEINTRLLYSLNDTSVFNISQTGTITVKSAGLDYDKGKHHYSLLVFATDGGTPELTGTARVSINVENENDNRPKFTGNNNFTVMEDAPMLTIIGVIQATDEDGDTVKYSLKTSTTDFILDQTTGLLSVNSSLMDKEQYILTIQASDGSKTATTTVTVTVLDINNHPPDFISPVYNVNVTENVVSASVVTVKATDKDRDPVNKIITYSIDPNWSSNFSISNTGMITVHGQLDRESMEDSGIKFVVMATDQGHPSLTGTTEVIIEVMDVNDNCPYFNTQDQKFTYDFKELDKPTNFHKIEVQDMDKTPQNRKMKYSFDGSHDGFTIHQGTGYISATRQFTMENSINGKITLHIVVSNIPNCIDKETAKQTVNINLQGVNRYTPQFSSSSYNFTLKENYTVGNQIKGSRIIATDNDASAKYNTITYWISGGNKDGHFYMDQKTAEIYLIKPLNYESKTQYRLQVEATDGHALYNGTYTNTSVNVLISVENVNNVTPRFTKDEYTCTFLENHKTSASCKVLATDSEIHTRLSYSLNDTVFDISQTGAITVKSAGLDYDKGKHHYSLLAFAADGGTPELTGTARISINVENENDNSPKFTRNYSFTVMEDAPMLTIIGVVQATDDDGDTVKYSLKTSTRDFSVNPNTGLLSVNSNLTDKTKYSLKVQATDGNNTATTTVTITVLDINNHPPEFISPVYSANVTENVVNASVTTVKAIDKDRSPENNKISYSIDPNWSLNFSISHTGIITVHGQLDRESIEDSEIKFVVMATDQGHPSLTGTTEVIIEVIDVNDNCPYINTQDQKFTYDFNELDKPTNFHKIEVQDMDKTSQNRIMKYEFVGSHDGFTIDHGTGYISATSRLTMENSINGKITLHILVSNTPNCTEKETAKQTVVINLQDVNRYTPQFSRSSYNFTLKENYTVGNQIKGSRIIASDNDRSAKYNTITYWIGGGNDGGHFYMDQKKADIYLVKALNYESKTKYSLQVDATDGHALYDGTYTNASVNVLISVENVNDVTPQFNKDEYTCTFLENHKTSTSCKVLATDSEINTRLSYSLNDTSVFNITQSGTITVKSTGLDYDKGKHHYSLLVFAADGGTPELTGTARVFINVENENDNRPKFTGHYNFTVMEDAPMFTIIGVIQATDDDGDTVKYSLKTSTTDFSVDPNTGLLSVKSNLTDKTQYSLKVQATDGNYTATTTVTVTVLDINNHPPVFISLSYNANATENLVNATVTTVKATDKDRSPQNNKISYRIDLPWSDNFTISHTGEIKVKGSLDREMIHHKNGQITLVVMATDNGNPQLTGTTEVIVEVIDVNDNCPYFNKEDQKFLYIFEELSDPHNFHTAVAYDKDSTDVNNRIIYKLKKGGTYFSVQPDGSLSANQKLTVDMTKNEAIDIEITVNNNGPCGSSMGAIVVQKVTVVLKDVNDHTPVFSQTNIPLLIGEDKPTGSLIHSMNATDKDPSVQYNTVHYGINPSNTHFNIDQFTGDVILVKPLDYETDKSYILKITATDGQIFHGSSTIKTVTSTVVITVRDVNDNNPKFDKALYRCSVSENYTGIISGCDFNVTDLDTGVNGQVKLTVSNKTSFKMEDNGSLWQMKVTKTLDYEKGPHIYNLEVQAVDKGFPSRNSLVTVEVTVTNVNDNPPDFIHIPYNFTIPEDIQIGSFVGRIMAHDNDGDTLSYSLTHAGFRIDEHTGIIYTDTVFLNKLGSITVKVRVIDLSYTTETDVMVLISDVNNNIPVFNAFKYHFTISENERNKEIGQVLAEDKDKGSNGEILYSLQPSDWEDHLWMDINTGEIHLNSSVEREQLHNTNGHITLVAMASDRGTPSLTGTTEVIVEVTDINDNCPYFDEDDFTYNINELTKPQNFHTVIAYDKDSTDINNKITYKLTKVGSYFSVQPDGSLSANQILRMNMTNNGKFDIEVEASNNVHCVGSGAVPNVQHVSVVLKDVNNFSPEMKKRNFTFFIKENFNTGAVINSKDRISAKDHDTSKEYNTVTYWIIGGNTYTTFHIDHYSGEIYLGKPLDYENGPKHYSLQISAIDCLNSTDGYCNHNDTAVVRVDVTDVNDNKPTFTPDLYHCKLFENTTGVLNSCKVKATDKDSGHNGVFTYISSDKTFDIDSSGSMSVKTKLDYESGIKQYTVIIRAVDNGTTSLTGTATVIVTLLDINDNPPTFVKTPFKFTLEENEPSSTIIGMVSAVDVDSNSSLTFTLQNHTAEFNIDNSKGILLTQKRFDYEKDANNYYIEVQVSDGKYTDVTTVVVTIININDNQPLFPNKTYHIDVKENIVTRSFKVIASDIDKLQPLSYSIVGNDGYCNEIYTMDDHTGELHINNTNHCLDYDVSPVHTLLIQANDNNPSHNSRSVIQIGIQNIDNKPPKFYWTKYTGSVKENEANEFVTKVKAFDSDTEENKLLYEVVSFTDEFKFDINTLMTKKKLDAEYRSHYTVNISVSDGPRKDFATVDVTVEDVNDNVPVFNHSGHFSVPANAKGNRFVGKISAQDSDISNRGFTYYLSEEDHFWIKNETGEIFVMDGRGNHQFEANKTYEVTINVIDHGQPPLTSSEKVGIFIDITNHNPPVFRTVNSLNIPENANIGSLVVRVTADDSDPGNAGKVFYQLQPNVDYDGKFSINKTTGQITLIGELDYEKVGHYELTVLAIDKADDPKTASTHVQINVDNINEKPQFLEKIDGMCIKFPIAKDQTVAFVSARDPDKGDNLTYSLTDPRYFSIGRKSGEIKAKIRIDRNNFTIAVIVKDKDGLNDTKQIDLYNSPSIVITPAVIAVNVTENSTDHFITKVNATSNSSLYYSIFNTTGFSIDQHGLITSDNALDREIQDQQVINVRVNSSGSYCQAQVTVKILDINDNPPRFGFQYDMPTIPENYPQKTCFFHLPVEDPDLNTILTFDIIDDNSGGIFAIQKYTNETGGCLMVNKSLDYESIPRNLHGVYSLMAEVSDGKYNSKREIKIHVTDVNDNYPYFKRTQYNTSVSENVPLQTSIIHLTAYDKDALDTGKLTYSLHGVDSSFFTIENTSHFGDLRVNTNLDRETNSSYTVTVVVEDTDEHESNTSIYITVLDVNDNAPKFTKNPYIYTIDEGPGSIGYKVLVSTIDPDLGENGTDQFILSNTYSGLFNMTTLDNNTGVITVLSALDRESPHVQKENGTAVFTLHIKAVDDGNPQKSAIEIVTLYVEDVNDCVPQFGKSHYNATVLEGSPKGFSIYSISASDCDYNTKYNTITYSLIGTGSELFEIDNDGLITLDKTISVESHKDKFDLTIVANDSQNTNTVPLTVIITDVNDHDPVFTRQLYTFYTPETDGIRTPDIVVGIVNATDADLGDNGVVTYSIISKDVKNLFDISQNGDIKVIGQLDRDTCISSRYPFTVIAEDNGISRRTGYTEVIIYIQDINDNSPVFTQLGYDGAVKENSLVDTEVIIVPPIHATDIDLDINGTIGIRYMFVGDNLPFRIDDESGEVLVNHSNLDRETEPVYNLQVRAVDRNGTGRGNTVNLTITLIDVNDVPPAFSTDNYTFNVEESAVAGQKIGVVVATDDDVNGNSTTRYRIASGSDGKFYVDILSGAVYTSGGLDREKKSKYVISIEAFDGQQKTNTTVYIYIQDVNDNCPVFLSQNLILRVPENTNISTPVYNLTAKDADEGKNAEISFYTNTSETLFIVNGRHLLLNGTLDREVQDRYMFKLFAKDHGIPPCHSNSTMEINVEDFNDNPPIFYNADDKIISQATATILEKSPVGSPIFFSDVKDNDIGKNAEISFSLSSSKPGILSYFKINPKTGVVSTTARIDLNSLNHLALLDHNATKTAALVMTVVATDNGMPPLYTNLILTVLVEGINDQAPVFLLPEYNFTVTENVPVGHFVGNVLAEVENGTYFKLKYSLITKSSSAEYFSVGQDSGNITTATDIDREKTPSFNFAVQVTDGKTPERTAYTVVSVTVTDLNDNSPEFTQRSYKYIIEENTIPQPLLVEATDTDSGQNGHVNYLLLDNPGDKFILSEDTGLLSVNGTLDREEAAWYNLTIQASDGGTTSLTDSVNVLVIVKDQNDNIPKFNTSHRNCTVRENEQPWTPVCEVKADDIDNGLNGTVIYTFTETHYPQFQIDPLDGSISTLVRLDYEEQSVYNLIVMAIDLGTPALNSTTHVTIAVQDEYDTQPHFTLKQYQITVDVNTPVSSVLLTVNGGHYHVKYAITDGNHGNHFTIGDSTGEITLDSKLGTSVLEYRLNISATDGISTDFTEVLVHVTTSYIQKQNNTYTAQITENINVTTLLLDLNYTDGSNAVFKYQLQQIIPNVKDTFELDQTTGELYCIKQLDRENVDKYVFHVRAVTSSNRKKRSFGDSEGEIIVVVYVQDENDNPPMFNGGQQSLTIGIPDTTNIGDLVTTLKAEDPDTSSLVKYKLSGGHDKDHFDVDGNTGKVYSQVKVSSQKIHSIVVMATDGTLSSQVNISFLVMSSFDKLILTIPITTGEFEKRQTELIRNISSIVGFKVEMSKYEVHVDTSKHAVDLSRTDIYFHGINETGGFIVPRNTAFRILHEKSKEIASLFDIDHITVVQYHPTIVPHKMSESEIALLTIGVIILLSCILALIAAKYTWNQFQYSQKTLQDKMWELNSLHSSHTNGTISMRQVDEGVVNPAFRETMFTAKEDQVSATNIDEGVTLSRRHEYESQEVILNLPFEPIDATLQQPIEGGAREMSLGYDSGLENESNSTSSAHEEARQDNEEIRIETVVQGSSEEHYGNTAFNRESSQSQNVFIFDMDTGDTDDGELEDDEIRGVKRRKSSKRKTNNDLKVFQSETGETTDDDDVDVNKFQRFGDRSKKSSSKKEHFNQETGEGTVSEPKVEVNDTVEQDETSHEDSSVYKTQPEHDINQSNDTTETDGEIEVTSF